MTELLWYLALRAPLLVLALLPLALSILNRWSPGYWLWAIWMIPMARLWFWLDDSAAWRRANDWLSGWFARRFEWERARERARERRRGKPKDAPK